MLRCLFGDFPGLRARLHSFDYGAAPIVKKAYAELHINPSPADSSFWPAWASAGWPVAVPRQRPAARERSLDIVLRSPSQTNPQPDRFRHGKYRKSPSQTALHRPGWRQAFGSVLPPGFALLFVSTIPRTWQ